jgi:two-component system cell cycle response regulator
VFACVVLGSTLLTPDLVDPAVGHLPVVTGGYLIAAAASEGLRRIAQIRGLTAVAAMLLLDGVYLAWVVYATGSTRSVLSFLPYVHLAAVTLLASHRTGLKIALWHSLLFFVVFYAQAARVLEPVRPFSSSELHRLWMYVLAFWFVAIATTLFSSLNERELRHRKRDLEALGSMAANLEQPLTPPEVADILLRRMGESFGFTRGVILGIVGGQARLLASLGLETGDGRALSIDSLIEEALAQHRPILTKRIDPDRSRTLNLMLPLARNVVTIRLHAEDGPLGVMVLEYGFRRSRIDRAVVTMVEQFAAHGSLALRNAFLLEEIQRLAETDPLTGVANRRTFHAMLEKELARAARGGEKVTLAMLDIDNFKKLNDEHGHQLGDEVLKKVAEALASECRSFDTPARYGGEEFAVILPSCSSKESLVAAERLRMAVARAGIDVVLTASAGVATFPTNAGDPNALIRAADEALYESKRAGRDRATRSRRRSSAHRSTQPTFI